MAQGRAKAVGVCWSEEELNALRDGIPVEYVRGGCVTKEEYQAAIGFDATDEIKEKKLQYMKKEELMAKAKELAIEISDDASITRADLILLIEQKESINVESNDELA